MGVTWPEGVELAYDQLVVGCQIIVVVFHVCLVRSTSGSWQVPGEQKVLTWLWKAGGYVIVNGKMEKCFEFAQEIHELKSKAPAEVGVWGHKTGVIPACKARRVQAVLCLGMMFSHCHPSLQPQDKDFANEKWALPVSGACLAWAPIVPRSDALHYYVPYGLVLANLKEKTFWMQGSPGQLLPPSLPKRQRKEPNAKMNPQRMRTVMHSASVQTSLQASPLSL